jgi:hypothetical protein
MQLGHQLTDLGHQVADLGRAQIEPDLKCAMT